MTFESLMVTSADPLIWIFLPYIRMSPFLLRTREAWPVCRINCSPAEIIVRFPEAIFRLLPKKGDLLSEFRISGLCKG